MYRCRSTGAQLSRWPARKTATRSRTTRLSSCVAGWASGPRSLQPTCARQPDLSFVRGLRGWRRMAWTLTAARRRPRSAFALASRRTGSRRALRVCCFLAAQADADMITLLGMSVPIDVKTGRQTRTLVAPSDLQASAHTPHLATGVSAELCAAACNLFAGLCRALHASRSRVRAVGCTDGKDTPACIGPTLSPSPARRPA